MIEAQSVGFRFQKGRSFVVDPLDHLLVLVPEILVEDDLADVVEKTGNEDLLVNRVLDLTGDAAGRHGSGKGVLPEEHILEARASGLMEGLGGRRHHRGAQRIEAQNDDGATKRRGGLPQRVERGVRHAQDLRRERLIARGDLLEILGGGARIAEQLQNLVGDRG